MRVRFSDHTTAVLALTRQRKFGGLIRRAVSAPLAGFGGWVSEYSLTPGHGSLLAHVIQKQRAFYWRVSPFDPSAALTSLPCEEIDHTQAIPLRDGKDAVLSLAKKSHRNSTSRARRHGLTVDRLTSDGEAADTDWESYYQVYLDSVRRWGEKATQVYRRELFSDLQQLSGVELWLVRDEQTVVAGAVCLVANRHVAYWHGAALESHLRKSPVNLLMQTAIEDAIDRGKYWFDCGSSGGLEGVAAFKATLGAETLPCPVLRRDPLWINWARSLRGRGQ